MKDKLIQLCDPAKFEYLINNAPNNTLSSTQIQNAVCSEKDYGIHTFFANTCGVIAEKIPVLAEGLYRCTIDSASIISSFKEMPCNPIRWNPTALVNKFCSTVGNNIGSFNTNTLTTETAFWGNTTIPTTETPLWDSTTSTEDPNDGTNIIKLIGVGAAATIAIGGMIYTGYRYFKSSKSTPKDTAIAKPL